MKFDILHEFNTYIIFSFQIEYWRGTMRNYYVHDGTTLVHPNAPSYETTERPIVFS